MKNENIVEVDYVKIGRRIAERRKELGLTQKNVCEKAGIGYKYLSNIERANGKASLSVINRIAIALETSLDFIVNGAINTKMTDDVDELYSLLMKLPQEKIKTCKIIAKAFISNDE